MLVYPESLRYKATIYGPWKIPTIFEKAPPMDLAWGESVFSLAPLLPVLALAALLDALAFRFRSASISLAINRLISLFNRAMAFSLLLIRSLNSSSFPLSA